MRSDPAQTVAALTRPKMVLARKIVLYAAAEVLDAADLDDEDLAKMVETTVGLLMDELSLDDACRIEFGEAARALAKRDSDALAPIVEFVLCGPSIGRAVVRERMRRDQETPAELDAYVDEYYDRWNHRWLSAIGAEALTSEFRLKLDELNARRGVVASPLTPTAVSPVGGSEQPTFRDGDGEDGTE